MDNIQPTQELTLEEEAQIRIKKIKHQKKVTSIILLIFGLISLGFITFVIINKIINDKKGKDPAPSEIIDQIETPEEKPASTSTDWKVYKNDTYKFFLRHPQNTFIDEGSETDQRIELKYTEQNQTPETITESNIGSGLIFRITPLNISLSSFQRVAEVKRESYITTCPQSAQFSDIQDGELNEIKIKMFTISRCNAEYKVAYLQMFGIYYEIVQIYRGGVGIEQKYGAIGDEMLKTFRFYPEDNEPIDPSKLIYKDYINQNLGLSLKYKTYYSDACCEFFDLPKPADNGIQQLLVFVDEKSYINKTNSTGVGVFYKTYKGTESFDTFIEDQKLLIADDYRVLTGKKPNVRETELQIAGLIAKKLEGINDGNAYLIYIQVPETQTHQSYALILSINNSTNSAEFENDVTELLQSILIQ